MATASKYLPAWMVLISCLLCSGHCFARLVSSAVQRWTQLKVQSLNHQHIDTVLCYHNECGGCWFKKSKNPCTAYDETQYLFWHKKSRYFACLVDKCGSHKIAPMDERSWAIIMNDYLTVVKLSPNFTYKDKTGSGADEMTIFSAGDDIPEDIFELYRGNGHSLLDISSGYLFSAAVNAEKPDEQAVKKIKEIRATIYGVMGAAK